MDCFDSPGIGKAIGGALVTGDHGDLIISKGPTDADLLGGLSGNASDLVDCLVERARGIDTDDLGCSLSRIKAPPSEICRRLVPGEPESFKFQRVSGSACARLTVATRPRVVL